MRTNRFSHLLAMAFILTTASCINEEMQVSTSVPPTEGQTTNAYTYVIDTCKNVDLEKAKHVAEVFASQNASKATRGITTENSIDNVELIEDQDGQPLFYIVNFANDQGYTLVGATQDYSPILAFSDEGHFDSNELENNGIALWFEQQKSHIRESKNLPDSIKAGYSEEWLAYNLKKKEIPATRSFDDIEKMVNDTIAHWNRMGYQVLRFSDIWFTDEYYALPEQIKQNLIVALDAAYPGFPDKRDAVFLVRKPKEGRIINPLLSTSWDQSSGYNTHTHNNYPAGCVAVAMGQIMKYYEYPENYAWDDMLDDRATDTTARLLAEIGDNVNMKYGPTASGAFLEDALSSFKEDYGYTDVTIINHRDDKVLDELEAERPVFMSGYDSNAGGHAWVCDGYKLITEGYVYCTYLVESTYSSAEPTEVSHMIGADYETGSREEYFHMNWALIGASNGFYIDSHVGNLYFTQNRRDITNIYPTSN